MKISDKGYRQAIENIAYEIFITAEESEANGESAEDMFALSLIDPKRKEYWDKLDKIVKTIAKTYQVELHHVQEDALVTIMEYHLKKQGIIA